MLSLVLLLPLAQAYLKPESWIGDLLPTIGHLSVFNLTLPGTHDSGAFWLSREIMPGSSSDLMEACGRAAVANHIPISKIFENWAVSQASDIFHQLLSGSRYLDLRVGWSEDQSDWHVYHFFVGASVKEVLQNVTQFLELYPQEIVIVEISHIEDVDHSKHLPALETLILNTLGSFLYSADSHYTKSLNELIALNQRVAVFMEKVAFKSSSVWSRSLIHNSYAETDKVEEMIEYNQRQLTKSNSKMHLMKISWTLTPDEGTIVRGFLPLEPHTLLKLAAKANSRMLEFAMYAQARGISKIGNIILVDNFETAGVIELLERMYLPSSLATE
mmetsp:Transcript_13756/g.25949  ORF Transcript_13756/g.25949 Transcript_13756/m.25949 type:complete len:330 (+) Transcript_13756:36-1025(+)